MVGKCVYGSAILDAPFAGDAVVFSQRNEEPMNQSTTATITLNHPVSIEFAALHGRTGRTNPAAAQRRAQAAQSRPQAALVGVIVALIVTLATLAAPSDLLAGDSNCLTLKSPQCAISYTDLAGYSWAAPFINSVTTKGIMTPCDLTTFCPEGVVTRMDMAFILENGTHRAEPLQMPAATGIFYDVPREHPLACWIEQLARDGITAGCEGSPVKRYCPMNPVTRAEIAVFLLRAKHGAGWQRPACTGVFADVQCSATPNPPGKYWAADWIEALYHEGITGGCASNPPRYCPNNPVTRAEMAVFTCATFATTQSPCP